MSIVRNLHSLQNSLQNAVAGVALTYRGSGKTFPSNPQVGDIWHERSENGDFTWVYMRQGSLGSGTWAQLDVSDNHYYVADPGPTPQEIEDAIASIRRVL